MWQGGMRGRGACMAAEACVAGGHVWQGACMVGRGTCMIGGMHGRRRGMHGRKCAWQGDMHGRRDGYCSGWYASYWNAFLFVTANVSLLRREPLLPIFTFLFCL